MRPAIAHQHAVKEEHSTAYSTYMDGGASADTVPELCAPPFTVEEFQSHPWGRRFTPAQAEKVVERLNRLHIEDPNSTMAVPAERMDLLVDPETQAHEELKAMAPPEEYLKRGRELIGSVGRQSLRWPGKRSFCKLRRPTSFSDRHDRIWMTNLSTRTIVLNTFLCIERVHCLYFFGTSF